MNKLYLYLVLGSFIEFVLTLFKRGGDLNYSVLFLAFSCIAVFSIKELSRKVTYYLVFVLAVSLVIHGNYYRTSLTNSNREKLSNLDSIVAQIDDKYLVTANQFFPFKHYKKVLTNDLFQHSTNVELGYQKDYVQQYLDMGEVNYIITDPFTKSFQHIPYDDFELIYENHENFIRWEVWKKK